MAGEKWVFTSEQLANTPSRQSGIDADKETYYKQQAANFIQEMGQRLTVTQLVINTAIVYLHRFYMFQSFSKFHRNSLAQACLFLAAKVEEQPRKLEHVIKVFHNIVHKDQGPLDTKSVAYLEQAQELVVNENILLQTLGFEFQVDHPHAHIVKTCNLIRAPKDLTQTSYFLATNSLHLTQMSLCYKPTFVACVCIHLACKWAQFEIPRSNEGKEWWFYVDKEMTAEILEELTQNFLSILDKCPSKFKKKLMSKSAKDEDLLSMLQAVESKRPKFDATATVTTDSTSSASVSTPSRESKVKVKVGGDSPPAKVAKIVSPNAKPEGSSHRPPPPAPEGVMRRVKTESFLTSLTTKEYFERKQRERKERDRIEQQKIHASKEAAAKEAHRKNTLLHGDKPHVPQARQHTNIFDEMTKERQKAEVSVDLTDHTVSSQEKHSLERSHVQQNYKEKYHHRERSDKMPFSPELQREQRKSNLQKPRPDRPDKRQDHKSERPDRLERPDQRLEQRVERPDQRVERPDQRVEQPDQRVERPDERVERPDQRVERPDQRVERPDQRVEHPDQRPDQRVERSDQRVERSDQRVERSDQRVERSDQRVERSDQRVERPDQRVERPDQRLERPDQRVERPDQRVERPDQRVERPDQRVERPDQRLERPDQRVERSDQRLERPDRPERPDQRLERPDQRKELRQEQRIERLAQSVDRRPDQPVDRPDQRSMKPSQRIERHDPQPEQGSQKLDKLPGEQTNLPDQRRDRYETSFPGRHDLKNKYRSIEHKHSEHRTHPHLAVEPPRHETSKPRVLEVKIKLPIPETLRPVPEVTSEPVEFPEAEKSERIQNVDASNKVQKPHRLAQVDKMEKSLEEKIDPEEGEILDDDSPPIVDMPTTKDDKRSHQGESERAHNRPHHRERRLSGRHHSPATPEAPPADGRTRHRSPRTPLAPKEEAHHQHTPRERRHSGPRYDIPAPEVTVKLTDLESLPSKLVDEVPLVKQATPEPGEIIEHIGHRHHHKSSHSKHKKEKHRDRDRNRESSSHESGSLKIKLDLKAMSGVSTPNKHSSPVISGSGDERKKEIKLKIKPPVIIARESHDGYSTPPGLKMKLKLPTSSTPTTGNGEAIRHESKESKGSDSKSSGSNALKLTLSKDTLSGQFTAHGTSHKSHRHSSSGEKGGSSRKRPFSPSEAAVPHVHRHKLPRNDSGSNLVSRRSVNDLPGSLTAGSSGTSSPIVPGGSVANPVLMNAMDVQRHLQELIQKKTEEIKQQKLAGKKPRHGQPHSNDPTDSPHTLPHS